MAQNRPYEDTLARKLAKERDGYICMLCGSDENVEGHHIFEYAYEAGASDAENIITLCHNCHRLVHSGEVDIMVFRS